MPLDDKRRRFFMFLAIALLGSTIGLGFLVVPQYIYSIKPSNVRFDETTKGQFYQQCSIDSTKPINNVLVVHASEINDDVTITCYEVLPGVDVLDIIKRTGISYDFFTYSVYGIEYKEVNALGGMVFRFLLQKTLNDKDHWYLSREVIPSQDFMLDSTKFHQTNEGITIAEVLDGINDYLNVPFT